MRLPLPEVHALILNQKYFTTASWATHSCCFIMISRLIDSTPPQTERISNSPTHFGFTSWLI
jgi:hypothetical protein